MRTIKLDGRSLTYPDLRAILRAGVPGRTVRLRLTPQAWRRVRRSRAIVESALREGRTVYGVNTGFGKLSDTRVDPDFVEELQQNLLLSHSAGMDFDLPPRIASLVVVLQANSLAQGYSGVTPDLVRYLMDMFNRGVVPLLPERGSVGASGDLAPLAQLGAVMVGHGKALHLGGGRRKVGPIDRPYRFQAKEALSLINGVQFSAAGLADALIGAEETLKLADIAGTMSLEALRGSLRPFDPRVHEVRPHPGQAAVARNVRALLQGSRILESHRDCPKVQDAYCLRCIPQVHGAVRDAFTFALEVLLREVNSATDNPLVFENGDVVSAGNFHGQPIAIAADTLTLAMASLGNISERRIDRMTNPDLSELPAFLVRDSGLNSGYMMIQVAAASLAAEARVDSAPASVHSIPTGGAKEDHVSMSAHAARKARRVVDLVRRICALELLCACQGLDFLRPLEPGPILRALHREVRRKIPSMEGDRYLQPEIERITDPAFLTHLVEFVERRGANLSGFG